MNAILRLWAREPVIVTGVFAAVLGVAVAFNVPVSHDQLVAIEGLIGAVGLVVVRSQVSPAGG